MLFGEVFHILHVRTVTTDKIKFHYSDVSKGKNWATQLVQWLSLIVNGGFLSASTIELYLSQRINTEKIFKMYF